MLKFIPWDIWAAASLAGAVVLVMIFEPKPAAFIVGYIFLCAYVVFETFRGAQR
jgi:hypothetical protein